MIYTDKPHGIKGIFLDLGRTLLYPPSGSFMFSDKAKQYFSAERLGALPQEKITAVMDRARQALDGATHVLTIEREYELFLGYYTTLSEELNLKLSPACLKAVTDDKVFEVANFRLFEDTTATLEALYGKYKLGIISDTWPSIVPVLESLDILKYFDCMTFSYELSVLKPDKRMYTDALAKIGLPAEETLFVDDSLKNVESAGELGITPVLITADGVSAGLDRAFSIDRLQVRDKEVNAAGTGSQVRRIDRISGLLDLLD